MMKRTIHPAVIIILILLISPTVVLGQNTDEACRAFVNRVFSDLGRNCAGLENNEVCYGYGEVNSTFNVENVPLVPAADYAEFAEFIEEGNQISIIDEDNVATLENLNAVQFIAPERANEDGEWGIAVLNVQANLPLQPDDNGATFILFGDVNIENAVSLDDMFLPETIVEVTVEDASIFNKPPGYQFDGYASEAVDTVSGTFEADAISPDGQWVRVLYTYERTYGDRTTAWLQTADLADEPDLSELPVLGPDTFAPMQDFYLDALASLPECDNAVPNGLLVQSPTEIETDIRVDELPIRLSSAAFLDQPSSRSLRLSVLDGIAQINPGSADEIIVVAGEEVVICLTEELDLGIDEVEDDRRYDPDCGIEGPFVFGASGSSVTDAILERFRTLGNLPGNVVDNLPTITIIRASGVGGPQISISINPPSAAQRIRDLCNAGDITGEICDLLR